MQRQPIHPSVTCVKKHVQTTSLNINKQGKNKRESPDTQVEYPGGSHHNRKQLPHEQMDR